MNGHKIEKHAVRTQAKIEVQAGQPVPAYVRGSAPTTRAIRIAVEAKQVKHIIILAKGPSIIGQ